MWKERLYDKNGSAGRGGKIPAVRTCKDEEGINGGMSRKPGGGGQVSGGQGIEKGRVIERREETTVQ